MTMSRICGQCGTRLTPQNTGDLKWTQPCCNRCTHTNPTCKHRFSEKFPDVCFLCGFDKNYNKDGNK